MLTWQSNSIFNKFILIHCLEGDQYQYIIDYVERIKMISELEKLGVESFSILNAGEMLHKLDRICEIIDEGTFPIIQLVMHGNKESGLWCGDVFLSWESLADKFRKINIKTQNNLIVISNVCFSAELGLRAPIHLPVPFYNLIAPEFTMTLDEFTQLSIKFFQALFLSASLIESYNGSLAKKCTTISL